MIFESGRDNKCFFRTGDNVCLGHFHRSVELLYVLDGEKRVIINGKELFMQEKQLLICPPYAQHSFFKSTGKQIVATVTAEFCPEFEQLCQAKCPQTFIVNDVDGELLRFIRQMEHPFNAIHLRGVINYLLGIYQQRTAFLPRKNDGEKDLVIRIAEFIHEKFAESITLDMLAERFGYSRHYFSALFKKLFSMGIMQYVNSIRVQKSVPLLYKQKISTVYFSVGFQNPQQYFLNFKRFYGCTPKEYLRSNKNSRS